MSGRRQLQHHDREGVPEHVVEVAGDALPLAERRPVGDQGTGAGELVAGEAEPIAELPEPPAEGEPHHPVLPAPLGVARGRDDAGHGDGRNCADVHDHAARLVEGQMRQGEDDEEHPALGPQVGRVEGDDGDDPGGERDPARDTAGTNPCTRYEPTAAATTTTSSARGLVELDQADDGDDRRRQRGDDPPCPAVVEPRRWVGRHENDGSQAIASRTSTRGRDPGISLGQSCRPNAVGGAGMCHA